MAYGAGLPGFGAGRGTGFGAGAGGRYGAGTGSGYGAGLAADWSPLSLGPSLAAWYSADVGCYTDAACLFASASSQYLSKTSPTFAPTTKMTIRFSWKPTSVGGFMALAAQYASGTDGFILWQRDTGVIWLALYGATDKYVQGTTVLTAGVQYEIVVVYDGTQALGSRGKIFINGVEETYASDHLPASYVASSAALCVGGNTTGGFYVDGALARLGFSSQALSGAALTAAHTSTFWADMTAARQADWFSFYNLCEASGTRVDSTGLNDLTAVNTPTVAAGPGEGLCVTNSPCKRVEDRTANANNWTQATIASQPLWIASGLNGLPVLRFDGVDDYMEKSGVSWAQPASVGIVGKATGNSSFLDAVSAADARGVRRTAATTLRITAGTNLDATVTTLATAGVLTAVFNGASSVVAQDGVETTGDAGATDATGIRVGRDGGAGTGYLAGDVAEVIAVTGAMSVAARTGWRTYGKTRYATP